MKWIGERTSFVDDVHRTTIVIDAENIGWQKAVMGAWVSMWMTIGFTMMWSFTLKLTEQEQIIVVIFLVFWAYYAYRVGRQFLWLLWGKEYIKINETSLSIKNGIKKYGKSKAYFLENITKMTTEQPKENSIQSIWEKSPWIKGGERIEFEYGGKRIKFGRKLNEKDTKILFQLISKRIEDQLKRKKKNS